jgi:hypothetical protein
LIDVQDLKANTDYVDLTQTHSTVKYFWEVISGFSQEDLQKLIFFCTGNYYLISFLDTFLRMPSYVS